jgi:hypothetical protein
MTSTEVASLLDKPEVSIETNALAEKGPVPPHIPSRVGDLDKRGTDARPHPTVSSERIPRTQLSLLGRFLVFSLFAHNAILNIVRWSRKAEDLQRLACHYPLAFMFSPWLTNMIIDI